MSDFEPLFESSPETSEFVPLDQWVSSDFEPMAHLAQEHGGGDFRPKDPSGDKLEGAGASQGLEPGQAGLEGGLAEDGVPGSEGLAEGETPLGEGEESEVPEELEDAIDPAIRAIEEAARTAGYERGIAQGEAEMKNRLQEVEDILAQVEGLRAEFFARAVQDVGKTVVQVAEKVIRREIGVSSGDIEGLIRTILQDVQADDDFVIRVATADAETMRAIYPSLLEQVGRDAGLRIEVDENLLPGGAVVETSYGRIDASIETQLEAFTAGIESWMTTEVEAHDD